METIPAYKVEFDQHESESYFMGITCIVSCCIEMPISVPQFPHLYNEYTVTIQAILKTGKILKAPTEA